MGEAMKEPRLAVQRQLREECEAAARAELRDRFAIAALPQTMQGVGGKTAAEDAYEVADAMMDAREEGIPALYTDAYHEGWSDALARALKIANDADPGDAMGIVAELKRVREASADAIPTKKEDAPLCTCGKPVHTHACLGNLVPRPGGGWMIRPETERVLESILRDATVFTKDALEVEDHNLRSAASVFADGVSRFLPPLRQVLRLVAEVTRTDQDLSGRTMAELGAAFRAANEACK